MTAGTPNEEARKRGIAVGSRIRCTHPNHRDLEFTVIGFDCDGDPLGAGPRDGYYADSFEVVRPEAAPDVEPVRAAAFVALMLRIDIADHTEEQIDRVFFRASEIADRYREAAARREDRRAGSDGVR